MGLVPEKGIKRNISRNYVHFNREKDDTPRIFGYHVSRHPDRWELQPVERVS
jgi:hypothetical protein